MQWPLPLHLRKTHKIEKDVIEGKREPERLSSLRR